MVMQESIVQSGLRIYRALLDFFYGDKQVILQIMLRVCDDYIV
jgi:hypothetical protein